MKRSLSVWLFVLLVTPVHAQLIDGRSPLTGARFGSVADINADFRIGLYRPGDIAWRSDAYAGDTLTITGNIQPEPGQVGQLADVLFVIKVGTRFFMINEARQIVPWSGSVASLVPRHSGVTLQAAEEFELYDGVIDLAGEFRFFIGYRLVQSGELYYTQQPQVVTLAAAPTAAGTCPAYGGVTVPVWHTSADGIFTAAPFAASDLSLITNGLETNDPRFSYQWIKNQGTAINIYAPADGVLVRIRHKAENLPDFPSDDYDLFFLVACDPANPNQNALVRFNHITNPRADIKAAYAFGALGAPTFQPVFEEHEERQVPLTNIAVRAGDYLGSTSGTPFARNFDFQIALDNVTVCPFSVLEAPHGPALRNMLGPGSASPAGPPTVGYACTGYGAAP